MKHRKPGTIETLEIKRPIKVFSIMLICWIIFFLIIYLSGFFADSEDVDQNIHQEEIAEFELTLDSEPEHAGNLSGAGIYHEQEAKEVLVKAEPNEGFEFEKWIEDGENISFDPVFSFELKTDRYLKAVFSKVTEHEEDNAEIETEGPCRVDEDRIIPSEFALSLYHKVADPDENVFISPASIYLALAMAYVGADGDTREEIGEVIHTGDLSIEDFNQKCRAFMDLLKDNDDETEVSIANSIWLDKGFSILDGYQDVLEKYHGAEAVEIEFDDPGSPAVVNEWVSNQTGNMIEGVLAENSPIPAQYFLLINAIYFMGNWTEEFDPQETEKRDFILADSSKIEVPMMIRESEKLEEYSYLAGEGFEAVRIPYGVKDMPYEQTRLAMYVFVPDECLQEFHSKLTADNWRQWMEGFGFFEHDIKVGLPRFKIEYETELIDVLRKMGIDKAFDQKAADFSAMATIGDQIFLDQIMHKAVIEVDEEGTEAAAVTGAYAFGDFVPEQFEVIADRPFFFVIRDDHEEVILFAGSVVNPR